MRRSWKGGLPVPLVVLAAVVVALSGCGGEPSDARPAVPEDCLQSWNAETASLTFGRHVYNGHVSRQAQILLVDPGDRALNIKGDEACAVIFVVEPSDDEYGDVGLVVTQFGWASMRELARGDSGRLRELQEAATAAPNARLFPDGTLDPM
jgi:hypothetical protein